MNLVISRFRSEEVESAAKVLLRFAQRQPTVDQLRKFLASDTHFFLAASIDGAWVGFAYAYELPRPDGTSMLFLYSIEVATEYRRRGVATGRLHLEIEQGGEVLVVPAGGLLFAADAEFDLLVAAQLVQA